MLRTTLSAAWSRKRRLLGTALAIILGVAFLSATLVLGDSARAGFEVAFTEANAGTDALVRSGTELTGGDETVRPPIDAGAGRHHRRRRRRGQGRAHRRRSRARCSTPTATPSAAAARPPFAAGWIDDPALTGWDLATGRAPRPPARSSSTAPPPPRPMSPSGDTDHRARPRAPIEATVVGIATFGDDDSIGGTTFAAFTTAEAQRLLLGSEDLVSGVVVAADDGVSQDELVSRLDAALPDGTEAITGADLTDEQQAEIEGDFLGFLTTALLVFACVALLVAAFSIFNTFSILVAQRTRESALLRALGASRPAGARSRRWSSPPSSA